MGQGLSSSLFCPHGLPYQEHRPFWAFALQDLGLSLKVQPGLSKGEVAVQGQRQGPVLATGLQVCYVVAVAGQSTVLWRLPQP